MESLLELNENTCRICLSHKDRSNSFFDIVELEEKIELKDVLDRVANVKVEDVEFNAPTRICNECTMTLLDAYVFVRRVELSERLLRDHHLREDKPQIFQPVFDYSDENKVNEVEQLDDDFQMLDEEVSCVEEIKFAQTKYEIEAVQPQSAEFETQYENTECLISEIEDNFKLMETNVTASNITLTPGRNACKNSVFDVEVHAVRKNSWHSCGQCHRSFAKVASLERHVKLAHTYAPPEEIAAVVAMIPNAPKEHFQCSHCPRAFARKDNLTRHVHMIHIEKETDQEVELPIKKRHIYKRGLCPYCGESFSQASLIVHMRRHTGETPYKCEDCDAGFPRRQDLVIHKRKHTGERPHVCTVCGKSFARPNKLTRHMRIHTGERPYKCTKCDRSFAQSNDLIIHIRRHTGEKPYKCFVCGDTFISGSALKSHQKLKEHALEGNEASSDPYEKIRVNNRKRLIVARKPNKELTIEEEVLDESLIEYRTITEFT